MNRMKLKQPLLEDMDLLMLMKNLSKYIEGLLHLVINCLIYKVLVLIILKLIHILFV